MPKPVALILLNWNTPEHTTNCIFSLQKHCNADLFDIVVTDNGSTDGSLSLLQQRFPDLIYIDNKENLGFAEGNNRALQYSIDKGYTFSLVMNTDTLVDSDLVTCLSKHLDEYLNVGAVQPAIYWMHDRFKIWNGKGKFNTFLGVIKSDTATPANGAEVEITKWVTGCCMLIRNSALLKSGLFNKRFFLYYEDVELSYRLRDAGYELHYLPSCKMYHEAGVSATVQKKEGMLSPIIHYYISRNHIWFLRQYGKPVFYPINFIYNGLYYLAVLTYLKLRGRNEKVRFLVKGIKEGLVTPKNIIWPKA